MQSPSFPNKSGQRSRLQFLLLFIIPGTEKGTAAEKDVWSGKKETSQPDSGAAGLRPPDGGVRLTGNPHPGPSTPSASDRCFPPMQGPSTGPWRRPGWPSCQRLRG